MSPTWIRPLILAVAVVAAASTPAVAQAPPGTPPPAAAAADTTDAADVTDAADPVPTGPWLMGRHRAVGCDWAPNDGPLLPHRIADLRHARASLRVISSPRWHRPQFDISCGGQVPLWRYVASDGAGWAFEAEIFGAFFMRTDIEHDTDVIGTDGYFGLPLVVAWERLAFKLELGHVSSHLGDETITATGRHPINYSKEEVVPGVSWMAPGGLRIYAEAAYAVRMGIEQGPHRERPWRFQWGVDWVGTVWSVPVLTGWDLESRQEVGFNITSHLEVGILIAGSLEGSNARLVFSWLVGRSVVKQNHDKRSQWWSIGFSGDL